MEYLEPTSFDDQIFWDIDDAIGLLKSTASSLRNGKTEKETRLLLAQVYYSLNQAAEKIGMEV